MKYYFKNIYNIMVRFNIMFTTSNLRTNCKDPRDHITSCCCIWNWSNNKIAQAQHLEKKDFVAHASERHSFLICPYSPSSLLALSPTCLLLPVTLPPPLCSTRNFLSTARCLPTARCGVYHRLEKGKPLFSPVLS